jgi:zinc/manganese transport system permease protein
MVCILGYLGIHVLEREIIFIDIALAQIAAVGSLVAFICWGISEHSLWAYLCAFGFTVIASLFYSKMRKSITQISQEAIIGVSYAIAAATALFLIAFHAGSDIHLEDMLTGSILWAKWTDIILCSIVFFIVGIVHILFRDQFIKISRDYQDALKKGVKVQLWDFLFYISMGIVITISIKIAGVLVIFSLLIMPATFSAMFTKSWKKRLFIAWIIGFVVSITGLAFSYIFDFSCGPSVITFLGVSLIIAALIKKYIPQSQKIE